MFSWTNFEFAVGLLQGYHFHRQGVDQSNCRKLFIFFVTYDHMSRPKRSYWDHLDALEQAEDHHKISVRIFHRKICHICKTQLLQKVVMEMIFFPNNNFSQTKVSNLKLGPLKHLVFWKKDVQQNFVIETYFNSR